MYDLVTQPKPAGRQLSEPRVLVAEDEYPWRHTIVRLVEELGVTCIAVRNGTEGAAILEDLAQPLSLAITDFRMPGGGGWRVVDAARAYRGASFPVIMQTGESQYPDVYTRAHAHGVTLIAKRDIYVLLIPAVRRALQLEQ